MPTVTLSSKSERVDIDFAARCLPVPQRPNLKSGKEYMVYAISVWRGLVFYQVVDEANLPIWAPCGFLEILDPLLPSDWICNSFGAEVSLVVGPRFISGSEEDYEAMVQMTSAKLREFRGYAEKMTRP